MRPPVNIRPYEPEDQPGVLRLLQTAFGRWPARLEQASAPFFAWKHLSGPFGPSLMMAAEADGGIVGFVAWQRWRVTDGAQTHEVLRAVDVAVDPAYRLSGVFSQLIRDGEKLFPKEVTITFSTPNSQSRPGARKTGRVEVGPFPRYMRPSSPIRTASRGARTFVGNTERHMASTWAQAISAMPGSGLSQLLLAAERANGRLETVKTVEYLRWRYGPHLGYRAVTEQRGGTLTGLAIFRVYKRGVIAVAKVCELIFPVGDKEAASDLIQGVARSAGADCLLCSFAPDSTALAVATRRGFLRLPGGLVAMVRQLDPSVRPDPTDRRSWALSLGDTDLF